MENFKCTCQATLTVSGRSGEWNKFFVARRLENVKYGRVCWVFSCLACDLLCLQCQKIVGFYVLEGKPGLEEIVGKVLVKENKTQEFFSTQKVLMTCIEGIQEVKETVLKVNEKVGKAEKKTINLYL